MTTYAEQDLWEEITFLGFHLHWDLDTLLDLEHGDRSRLLQNVAGLNRRVWEEIKSAL